jgi:hypothetical protein
MSPSQRSCALFPSNRSGDALTPELPPFELTLLDELAFAPVVSQLEFAHPEDAAAALGVNRVTGDMT